MDQQPQDVNETGCSANLRSIQSDVSAMRYEIAKNTITAEETRQLLDQTITEVRPIIKTIETMEHGVKVIGKIGVAGAAAAKIVIATAAIGVFVTVLMSSGSFQSAIEAAWLKFK